MRPLVLGAGLPAAALAIAAGIALLLFPAPGVHVLGYCLTCLIPFLLVAGQRHEAMRQQAELGVVRANRERWIAAALLGIGFVFAAVHAWQFALAVS